MGEIAKLLLVPGSIAFFTIGLLAGVALLYGRPSLQRWGRRWLTSLVAAYAFLATPVGAGVVGAPLRWQYGSVGSKQAALGVDTIVTLTTGVFVYRANDLEWIEMGRNTSHNALETARLYRLLGQPTIVATGGIVVPGSQKRSEAEVLQDALLRLGIPADHIVLETRARNTREQAERSAAILRQRGAKRFVLVTDAGHMPRAVAEFRAQGLDPLPSAAVVTDTTPDGLLYRLRPSLSSLKLSDEACYEYGARVYYWILGVFGQR